MNINLGKEKDSKEFNLDLEEEGVHFILLLGQTGSGKSTFHESVYQQIVSQKSPNEVGFVFLDMTAIDFKSWEISPYLYYPVTTNANKAIELIEKLAEESILRAQGKQNKAKSIFIHIEECDLFYAYPERIKTALTKLLESKSQSNMYMVFSTSRVDPTFLTYLLKLADLKVVFQTATENDYRLVVGSQPLYVSATKFKPGEKALVFKERLAYLQPLNILQPKY